MISEQYKNQSISFSELEEIEMSSLIRTRRLATGVAYYTNFNINGRRKTYRIPYDNEKQAIIYARDLKRDLLEKARDPNYFDRVKVKFAYDKYKHQRNVIESKVKYAIEPFFNYYLDEIKNPLINTKIVTPGLLKGLSNATINRRITMIQAVVNFAHTELELLPYSCTLKKLDVIPHDPTILSIEQCVEFMSYLDPYLRDPVKFIIHTGLRRSNVTGLKQSWIKHQDRTLVVPSVSHKSKKQQSIKLNKEMYTLLMKNIAIDPSCEFVFKKPDKKDVCPRDGMLGDILKNKSWIAACKKMGIKIRVHDLRHTFACLDYGLHGNIFMTKERLGHSKIETTQIYAKLVDGAKDNEAQDGISKLFTLSTT